MNQVNEHELTVMVHIDGRLFRNFALFDTFRRQRKWVSPALFAAIMIGFSCVCFALRGQAEQAVLLGGTLLAVGLLLPAAYFLNFFLSVRTQVKKLGLTTPQHVYTVVFQGQSGVSVSTDRKQTFYSWEQLYAAYRVPDGIYLYAAPQRAYLLPADQIAGGVDGLWELLCTKLPQKNLHAM